jgi:rod shape-determining protein MreC
MKRPIYLLIAVLVFFQLSLSSPGATRLRSMAVGMVAPPVYILAQIKRGVIFATTIWPFGGYRTSPKIKEQLANLQRENFQLKEELSRFKAKQEISGEGVVGKVIFRQAASWSSSLWIDVGKNTSSLIAKNSPVVLGSALVGVVEYVGLNRSRVRLITDPALTPAVVGKASQAKGEIQGTQATLFRSRQAVLRGAGFYGEVRPGDLLVTSGLDGVFPEGLEVAEVSTVFPLTEGASSYELEAVPIVKDLGYLKFLTVLPTQGVDEEW